MNTKLEILNTNEVAQSALVTLQPKAYAATVYAPFKARLADAIQKSENVAYDVKTPEGMTVAKEHRAIFRAIRIEGEKSRKSHKDPIIAIGKLLDSKYAEIEAAVTPHENKFDADIKAEEARREEEKAEKIRIEEEAKTAVQNRIDAFKNKPIELLNASIETIERAIADLSPIYPTKEEFGDRVIEAEYAIKVALDSMQSLLDGKRAQTQIATQQAEAAKAQQAELAEQSRVDGIKSKIQTIKNYIIDAADADLSSEIDLLIARLNNIEINADVFNELESDAQAAKDKAINALGRQRDSMADAEAALLAKQKAAETIPTVFIADNKKLEAERVAKAKQEEAYKPDMTLDEVMSIALPRNEAAPEITGTELSIAANFKTRIQAMPSVNDIVTCVSNHFMVSPMVAQEWLIDSDFGQKIAA